MSAMCRRIAAASIDFMRRAMCDSSSWQVRHAPRVEVGVIAAWCSSRRMPGAKAVMHPAAPPAAAAIANSAGSASARRHVRTDRTDGPYRTDPARPQDLNARCDTSSHRDVRFGRRGTAPTRFRAIEEVRETVMLRSLRAFLPFVLLLACGDGTDIGAPCDKDDQCVGDLICDVHDGKGTCQTPHDHVSAGLTGTAMGTAGAVGEVCASYCMCLEQHCARVDHFPYADAAACTAACGEFTDEERTCWTAYCAFAVSEDPALTHYCEHASGSLGVAECG